ncbi:MAG: hypothetical protein Q9201_004789 [Fulgogasparrea decipioides]
MAKIKKKGTSGQAKNFITRTQAVRKLQISLPDFRRLCIYKGIYPREPRNKKKASKTSTPSTTFYYSKDIQYLLHEPILNKFRDHKALAKKIARSLGRGEVGDAARLEKNAKPRISLDHIIKERYPTFVDALRDLDDALSLLFLFASLPSTSTVPPRTISLCQRLCLEFEHYLIVTHALRKSFISIKGIYYQATVQGQDILWLVPHKFVQRVSGDVDFRIMGTFVEFYTTLLGFVNYRLYTSIGLVYPPRFNVNSDEQGGELGAIKLEGNGVDEATDNENQSAQEDHRDQENNQDTGNAVIQKLADELARQSQPSEHPEREGVLIEDDAATDTIDQFEIQGEGADVLIQPSMSDTEAGSLFAPYSFFLSRETPRQPLEFILRAFGCKRIGWDEVLGDGAFTNDPNDPSITHQVVDRPLILQPDSLAGGEGSFDVMPAPTQGGRIPGRTYIQPQWVWDCINQGRLLRVDRYAPGTTLPPHLSPWVKPTKITYDPTAPLADQESEGEGEEEKAEGSDDEQLQKLDRMATEEDPSSKPGLSELVTDADDHGMDVASADSENISVDEFGGFASDDEETNGVDMEDQEEDARSQHQKELEAEAAGLIFTERKDTNSGPTRNGNAKSADARKKAARLRKEEDEDLERRKMMMSKKKRKLFDRMTYSNRALDEEAAKLRSKRRKLERTKS